MARKNIFKHTVADANKMVRSNKPAAKAPKQTIAEAFKQAGVRTRIEESDDVVTRGYKKSLSDSPFAKQRKPLPEKKAPKQTTSDEKLRKLAKKHGASEWDIIRAKGELADEKLKAALKKLEEGEE